MTNANKHVENTEWQVASISDVTVYIKDSGTDTNTARYLDMGKPARSWILRTDQVISIEEINGFTLKEPLVIPANGSWTGTNTAGLVVWEFKVNVLTANTNLKLFAETTMRGGR